MTIPNTWLDGIINDALRSARHNAKTPIRSDLSTLSAQELAAVFHNTTNPQTRKEAEECLRVLIDQTLDPTTLQGLAQEGHGLPKLLAEQRLRIVGDLGERASQLMVMINNRNFARGVRTQARYDLRRLLPTLPPELQETLRQGLGISDRSTGSPETKDVDELPDEDDDFDSPITPSPSPPHLMAEQEESEDRMN